MKKKILIIDDENFMRTNFGSLVRRLGYDVIVAGDAAEGISHFKSAAPAAVFIDIMLPDLDGEKVFREIKSINDKASVFFMSASEERLKKLSDKHVGAQGYLSKPIFMEQLKDNLKDL